MTLNKLKIISIILCGIMCITLCSCGNTKDKIDTNAPEVESIQNQVVNKPVVEDGTKQDITGTGIYGIKAETIRDALANIQDIQDNFVIETSSNKRITKTENGYSLTKSYIAKCIPTELCTLLKDDFKFNVSMLYKGESNYPDSLNLTFEYLNLDDKAYAEEWAHKLLEHIVNTDVKTAMQKVNYNGASAIAYEADNAVVNVQKTAEDMTATAGNHVLTFVVFIKDKTVESTDDISVVELDKFNMAENPQFGVFNTGIASYGEKLSKSVDKIAKFFGETCEANLETAIDIEHESDSSEINSATLNISINSRNNGDTYFNINTKSIDNLDTSAVEEYFKITTSTLNYGSKTEAFYAAEDILEIIVGRVVELQDYIGVDEFNFNIDESANNTSWGYPINISCKVISNEDKSCSLDIVIETTEVIKNTENIEEVEANENEDA